jgi:CheY-like chemotaxis protein
MQPGIPLAFLDCQRFKREYSSSVAACLPARVDISRVGKYGLRKVAVISASGKPRGSPLEKQTAFRMNTDEIIQKYTVVLADDHVGFLRKVSDLLTNEFNIVAMVSDGTEAVQAALEFKPDIFILDICMTGLDGIQVAREIKRLGLSTKIVLLTIQEDADYIEAARAIGACYVLKCRMHADLPLALEETLAGRTFISQLSTK